MTSPKKPKKIIRLIDVREVVNKIISEEISMSRGQEILNEKIHDHKLSHLPSESEIEIALEAYPYTANMAFKGDRKRIAKLVHSLMRERMGE